MLSGSYNKYHMRYIYIYIYIYNILPPPSGREKWMRESKHLFK